MLYGISTSFPVLSRLERQVAHALLTRPPLSYTRRYNSVRLECVMHAASVHPEPGSNSRLKKFYLSLSIYYYLGIVEIFGCISISWLLPSYFFVLSLRCSIFKDHFFRTLLRVPSLAAPYYYITFFSFCQHFFEIFFEKFYFGKFIQQKAILKIVLWAFWRISVFSVS